MALEPPRQVTRLPAPRPSLRRPSTLEEAKALHSERRFEEALLAVESVLEAQPADAQAHLLVAKLQADQEQVGAALRHCRRALEVDPLLEEGHYLMGLMLLHAGEKTRAIDALSRVVYLNPSGSRSALAHFHLGGLHWEERRLEVALREYRNALRLLKRLPREELLEEFSADFLSRVCRRKLEELEGG